MNNLSNVKANDYTIISMTQHFPVFQFKWSSGAADLVLKHTL